VKQCSLRDTVFAILACFLLAGSAAATDLDYEELSITIGTNSALYYAATNDTLRGWIWEIIVDNESTLSTADVDIVWVQEWDTVADVSLLSSNALVADMRYRPVRDWTDTSGAALTSDPPALYPIWNGHIELQLTNATRTNITFSVKIGYEKK